MAVLTTTNPETLKYLTWIAQTLAHTYEIRGVPMHLIRGNSLWLQERMAEIVCSIISHEVREGDGALTHEQLHRISAKVIRYCAGILDDSIKLEYPL